MLHLIKNKFVYNIRVGGGGRAILMLSNLLLVEKIEQRVREPKNKINLFSSFQS